MTKKLITSFPLFRLAKFLFVATAICILLYPGRAAASQVTYTYTGNPMAVVSNGQSITCINQVCSIQINLVLAAPLSPNLFDASISPINTPGFNFACVFSDLSVCTGLSDFTSTAILISTDSSGNITNWSINLTHASGPFLDIIFTNNGEDFVEDFETGFGALGEVANSGTPGTWTCSGCVTTTGPTPEPSSLLLLGTGLVALGASFRRRPVQLDSHSHSGE